MSKLFETVTFFSTKAFWFTSKICKDHLRFFFNLGPILEKKFQVNQSTIDNLDAEVQIFRDHNFFLHFFHFADGF